MITLIIVVVILGLLYYLFPLICVIGDSMYPTYKDGEIILGRRIYKKSNLKSGDVIIYRSPTEGDKIVIKRIFDIIYDDSGNPRYFYCLGDNPECSYDSRSYGFFSSSNLVCRVIKQRRNKRCM